MSTPRILLNFLILFVILSVTKVSAAEIEECIKLIIDGGTKAMTKIFSDLNEVKESINDLKSSILGSDIAPMDLEFFDIRYDVLPKKCVTDILPKNCVEATACTQRSGIYKILVTQHSNEPFYVECDAETEGGGWIVIQRRQDGSVDFHRNWVDYEKGFGDVKEHFIGLKKLYSLTNAQGPQELLIEMGDVNNSTVFAKYNGFSIGDETEMYKLKELGMYSGTAGDSLRYHLGMKFSTKDRDNDDYDTKNCADVYTGAWWYKNCHHSNLNGKYGDNTFSKGINWKEFRGYSNSLKNVKMMIRGHETNSQKK